MRHLNFNIWFEFEGNLLISATTINWDLISTFQMFKNSNVLTSLYLILKIFFLNLNNKNFMLNEFYIILPAEIHCVTMLLKCRRENNGRRLNNKFEIP
jgi:hypothetical protein